MYVQHRGAQALPAGQSCPVSQPRATHTQTSDVPTWAILSTAPAINPEVKDFADLLYKPLIENLTGVHVLGGLPTAQEGPDFLDIASGNYNNNLQGKTKLQELQK